ncbi:hypothetical protein HHI36_001964, partial [Cryptolaemus montrouzieri]
VALLSVLAVVRSAVIIPEHTLVESPLERTSIVGPSGTITVDKNIPLVTTELHAVEPVLKIAKPSTVIAEPVVKAVTPVVSDVPIVNSVPALKTIAPVVSEVPVLKTITPYVGEFASVVPHYSTRYVTPFGAPLVAFVSVLAVVQSAVIVSEDTLLESPLERTSIVGPSGTITVDKKIPLVKTELHAVEPVLKIAEPSTVIAEPVVKSLTPVVPELPIVDPVPALNTITPFISEVPALKTITPFVGEVDPIVPHYSARYVALCCSI